MQFFLLFGLWLAHCVALKVKPYKEYGDGGRAWFMCTYALRHTATLCSAKEQFACYCGAPEGLALVAGCVSTIKTNKKHAFNYAKYYCKRYYNQSIHQKTWNEALELYHEKAKHPEDIPGFNMTEISGVPVILNTSVVDSLFRSYKVYMGNLDSSLWYGLGSVGFWFVVAFVSMVAHWSVIIFPELRSTLNGRAFKLIRKHITLPALMRRRKSKSQGCLKSFDFMVPSRLDSLVIVLFTGLQIGVNWAQIYFVHGESLYGSRNIAITRYVSDRTGIISLVLTPLLLFLGGRNEVLSWVTGWKMSTMMLYHRWIARFVVLLAIIHSFGYTWLELRQEGFKGYSNDMKTMYLKWGAVSTTAGGVLLVESLLYFRRHFYDLFLVIHIVLAAFFLVGLWYHVVELGYQQFVYPCFAVWLFDRLVRIIRLFWFGFPMGKVSLVGKDVLKLQIPKRESWPLRPGGHAWVYFLDSKYFWQSHPFTFVKSVDCADEIVFYCKVKNGITRKMADKLASVPGKQANMRVGVEGPYGTMLRRYSHSDLVFIAGGGGIPGVYSEAIHMAKVSRSHSRHSIRLVWIIRDSELLKWFDKELEAIASLNVEIKVFITRQRGEMRQAFEVQSQQKSTENVSGTIGKEGKSTLKEEDWPGISGIEVVHERPDIGSLVGEEIEKAKSSVAFVSCGHPALIDDLRYHVVKNIDQFSKRVDFFEQLEVWA